MVPVEKLKAAIDQLNKWDINTVSSVSWVNWRGGYQIKMGWYRGAALNCYLDFKADRTARDAVLKDVFNKFAVAGQKPKRIDGHGWSCMDYSLDSTSFISVNEVADIAQSMGYEFTVIYVQECVTARPVFGTMGIPLVPGESGKEWAGDAFLSYCCPLGQNL